MPLGQPAIDGAGGDLFTGGYFGGGGPTGYAWGVRDVPVFHAYEGPAQYSPDPEAPLTAQPAVPPAQPMVPRTQDGQAPKPVQTAAVPVVTTATTTSLSGWVVPVAIVIVALVLIKK